MASNSVLSTKTADRLKIIFKEFSLKRTFLLFTFIRTLITE